MSKRGKIIAIILLLVAFIAILILIKSYNTGSGTKLSKKATDFKYHTSNFIKLNEYEDELWDFKNNPDKVNDEIINEKCTEAQAFINDISNSDFKMLSLYDDISSITDVLSMVKDNEYSQIEKIIDEIVEIIGKTDALLTQNNSSYQGSIKIINQCMLDLENDEHNPSVDSTSKIRLLNEKFRRAISETEKNSQSEK